MSTPYMTWADLCDPALPDHATEVMAAHTGAPSIAEQNRTHGAPASGEGHGTVTGDGL